MERRLVPVIWQSLTWVSKFAGTHPPDGSIAEESVVYPAMAESGDKRYASHGDKEQATVKIEMAELEEPPPSSDEFLEKLGAIEEAVAHRVYEKEKTWFPALKEAGGVDEALVGRRHDEEFARHNGEGRAMLR